jgi:S1-C subfamily serine protease
VDEQAGVGPTRAVQGSGIPLQSLVIASHTVFGHFKENDVFSDTLFDWSGTAAAVSIDGGKLYLVTNSHVLGLKNLAISDDDTDAAPDVAEYTLSVQFATGKLVPVLRMFDQDGALDLALLEVEASGLAAGRDYVLVPYDRSVRVVVGDEAVAVGSPHKLAGTHTFGRISAIRMMGEPETFRAFQTDAAINPGNSGGPLFKKQGTQYLWIGVNTWIEGSDNLGFAIDARHVWESKYQWYYATPQGAAEAVRRQYGRKAVVE